MMITIFDLKIANKKAFTKHFDVCSSQSMSYCNFSFDLGVRILPKILKILKKAQLYHDLFF